MPRRRWRLRDRREPLSPAMRAYLELGLGGLQASVKASRPDGYEAAVYFTTAADRAKCWEQHGEEVTAAWIAAHPGTRPWGWWQFVAQGPRACLEGAEFVWKPGLGDWVWKQELGLPGRPQARRPGASPARLLFESQATYLRRLSLLVSGEAELISPADFEPEIVAIPALTEMERISARPASRPAPLASTNGADR
jgi:hypothetical protein